MDGMFLTLTGYLELLQKPAFGKPRYRKYWFLFDENSCALHYYVDSNANILQPLGKIDMTNVSLSPCGETGLTNEFVLNCSDGKVHYFKATDWKEASDWIRKLERKREGWCKSAVKKHNTRDKPARPVSTLDSIKAYKTGSKPRSASLSSKRRLNVNSGLIEKDQVENSTDEPSPSSVKRIIMEQLQKDNSSELLLKRTISYPVRSKSAEPVETNNDETDGFLELIPEPPNRAQSLYGGERSPSEPIVFPCSDDEEDSPSTPVEQVIGSSSPIIGVQNKRRLLKLQEELYTAHKTITTYARKNLDLKSALQDRDKEIERLRKEVEDLNKYKQLSNIPETKLRTQIIELQDIITSYEEQKKLLFDELKLRMNQHQKYEEAIQAEQEKYTELEQELYRLKAKYVVLLGNSIKINTNYVEQTVVDPEEEKAKKDLLGILKNEAGENLPFVGSDNKLQLQTFEDQYGELHDWAQGNEIQHFLCHQLYLHFTSTEKERHEKNWSELVKSAKKNQDRLFEKSDRELRLLLRRGIPVNLRSKIWAILVEKKMGKARDIKDQATPNGSYYHSISGRVTNPVDDKQIGVDLERTLPHNKHFRKDHNGPGVTQLKNILLAYSTHNPNLGYCQGMNMLVAVGLLFLDEETSFWLLTMIIEKMTPPDYYSPGLLGAQADQELTRELVAEKLPALYAHLTNNCVDIAVITFNWLLAAFVDALPTESMLRIWDCFLYEGRKVLYRFTLAILRLNERKLLQMHDPNAILSYLKKVPKHIFNMDEVFNEAFTSFEPFPNRHILTKRHDGHMQKVKAKHEEEEKLRAAAMEEAVQKEHATKKTLIKARTLSSALLSENVAATRKPPIWECGCVISDDEVWLGCGERQGAKVCVINCEQEKLRLEVPLREFSSRLCCMKTVRKDLVVFGTLDFTIHAVNATTRQEVWNIKVKDSVLDVVGSDNDDNLFAGLADGTMAIILASGHQPPPPCPLLVRIGMDPVTCMVLTDNELWCGSGSSVSIICSKTMEPLKSLSGADRKSLYKMAVGTHGVWMSYRSSPLITLYHVKYHVRLLEIDYTQSLNLNIEAPHDSQVNLDQRITSILPHDNFLWVGTGGGCVCVFSILPNGNVTTKLAKLLEKSQEGIKEEHLFEQSVTYQHGLVGVEETISEDDDKIKKRVRRRKEFGRTFHARKLTSSGKLVDDDTSLYHLDFMASHHLTSQHADAVRAMVPLSFGDNPYMVTCCRISKVDEASKSVQLWYCPVKQHPQKWQYQSIDCNAVVMRQYTSNSALSPTLKLKPTELPEDVDQPVDDTS
ncbi:TBC1 domain family member 2B-like [Dysidea avara]|uniref:TBC1 domain family member 2B-like n=1 Tax=Dysidea avara TaxID=196820 RepID=UPI003323EF2B